jgi:hypothetical protein
MAIQTPTQVPASPPPPTPPSNPLAGDGWSGVTPGSPTGSPPLRPRRRIAKKWWWIGGAVVLLAIGGIGSALSPPAKPSAAKVAATSAPVANAPATAAPTAAPTAVPTAAPTAAPTAVPTAAPPAESQAQIVADFEATAQAVAVSKLVNSPSTYNGSTVSFTATIVNFLQDSSGNTTAMNVSDPTDFSSLVYVQLSSTADVTKMNKGDTIKIWGDGSGTVSGTNAYGGSINESAVTEVYTQDITSGYLDNSDPNPS